MGHIKGFNALRAISVILVVATHLDLSDLLPQNDFVMSRVWLMISGTFGVQVFFVLSGFLITRILLHELEQKGTIQLKNFFAKRFIRLLPPLLIFGLLMFVANLFGYLQNAKESALYAIFYVYNFVPHERYSLEMGHFWSLGVEEQFYMLWPFLLLIFKRFRSLVTILVLLIVSCVIAILLYNYFDFAQGYFFLRWFIPASAPILIGCLGAIFLKNRPALIKSIVCGNKWIIFLLIALYAFPLYTPVVLLPISFVVQSFSVVGLLLRMYFSQEKNWVNWLEIKPLSYIGMISYGIYVYQGFFLRTGGGSELWFQQLPYNIVFTIIIAVVSFELIEKPILRLKNRFN